MIGSMTFLPPQHLKIIKANIIFNTYLVLATALNSLQTSSIKSLEQFYAVGTVVIFILQMRKLRPKDPRAQTPEPTQPLYCTASTHMLTPHFYPLSGQEMLGA